MIVNKMLKMLALFFLVGLVAATSGFDVADSTAAQCEAGCRPFFARCVSRHKGADFCRNFTCEYYGSKVCLRLATRMPHRAGRVSPSESTATDECIVSSLSRLRIGGLQIHRCHRHCW